jgi:cyclopropane fatty-acyl-phospholipid synthase-like methyltransferase
MQAGAEVMAEMGFSEACERNKLPILNQLQQAFGACNDILEVGSGTGQHAVYFARALRHLSWQPTDTGGYLPGLRNRIDAEAPGNVVDAIELDVRMSPWPVNHYDGIFSANTLHYMGKDCVEAFFSGVAQALLPGGVLVVYGPFRYQGDFTSSSNARFDNFLKQEDPQRGIRDFEWITELASAKQLELRDDYALPANNQLLVWRRATTV